MAFTMHSHSGQFCPGHAKDQLEDIIKHAIELGYKTFGLTEHMPRYEQRDLYPEEVSFHSTPYVLGKMSHEFLSLMILKLLSRLYLLVMRLISSRHSVCSESTPTSFIS